MVYVKGDYGVKVDKVRKAVKLTFKGFFRKGEGEAFVEAYEDAKKQVVQSVATLYIDGTELACFNPNVKQANIGFYKDYAKFKEVYIIAPKDAAARGQLENCLKEAGVYEKFHFVNSLNF